MFGTFEIRLFQQRTFNIEILYLLVGQRTFVKRELYEEWQGVTLISPALAWAELKLERLQKANIYFIAEIGLGRCGDCMAMYSGRCG